MEIVSLKTCSNCFAKFKRGDGNIECRLKPPMVYPILGNDNLGQPILRAQIQLYPVMQPDQWCREHKAGLTVTPEEMAFSRPDA